MPLGHAGLMGVSGYSMGYLISRLKWSWPEAVVVALLLTLVVSLVFGLLAVRTSGIFFVMITMAEGMLVWGLAYRWSSVTGADNGMRGITRPDFAMLYWQYYYLVLAVFAVCALLLVLIVRSPFGLTLKGIRESASRMHTLGYNVTLHKLIAFLVSGFFAGVAVLLAWYSQFISPSSIYIVASTEGILMVVLGGIGTLLGPVLGTIVIGLIKSLLSTYVARWPLVMGLIFIVVVLFARARTPGCATPGVGRAGHRATGRRQPAAVGIGAPPPLPAARRKASPRRAERQTSDAYPGGGRSSHGTHQALAGRRGRTTAAGDVRPAGCAWRRHRTETNRAHQGRADGAAHRLHGRPGRDMVNGWNLYLKVNGNKWAGREVITIVEDDAGDPTTALTKARQLIEQQQVDMIVGPLFAHVGLALADYVKTTGTPNFHPIIAADDLTQRHPVPNVIRVAGWTSSQPQHPFGEWAYDQGYRKVMGIFADSAHGQESSGGFNRTFTARGGQIVKQLWPPLNTPDFSSYLAQVPDLGADAVATQVGGADAIRFVKQWSEFGLKGKVALLASEVARPGRAPRYGPRGRGADLGRALGGRAARIRSLRISSRSISRSTINSPPTSSPRSTVPRSRSRWPSKR